MTISKVREIITRNKNKESEDSQKNSGGEGSISGHMPSLESDDSTLDAAQNAGLYLDSSESKSETVNIAREINEAEKDRRNKKP